MAQYAIGKQMTGEDFRRARDILGMTQKEFAAFAGCSPRTVENWETKPGPVTGPVVTLLEFLFRWPELVGKLEVPERKTNLRLWYMYKSMVCTVIDVDEMNRLVTIRNYISNPLYRAFGVDTEPDYEAYEAFLESRCFPRTMDKMKIELRALGIPFYDPLLIIEKTEGRMAEDDFWIRIERNSHDRNEGQGPV